MIETHEYEGIIQIKMSRELNGSPVYWVAAYLVDGLLIDTGCSYTSGELASFLTWKNLRMAVNTHYHEDHIGGNHDIMKKFDVDVFAHPDAVPLIAQKPTLYPYQEIAWGYPVPTTVRPISGSVYTARHKFRIIETPGHCAGHIALMEMSKGWCFTGDIFARENPKFIRPEENIGEIIKSCRLILSEAGERLVLFTSVGKIIEDGRNALTSFIEYISNLAEKVQAMARNARTIEEIINDEFGGEHDFAKFTDAQFSTRNLVRSLLEMKLQ